MAQSGKNKKGSKDNSNGENNGFKELVSEYGTQSNILKGIGIAAGIGALAYVAYKYIPFEKLFSNLEDAYDEKFGEGQNANRELANVEE